jgi:Gas vesicle synthesis protein GvpL/GvpF
MALHVYGVVSAATRLPGTLRGRREAPVRLIVHSDLAAVVSDVDADARIRRDDLLAHARVLESLVEASTVLPMRFGVIVETDEEVARNILEPGEGGLTGLLRSFDGCVQLTVKAHHDQDQALRHLLRERPDLRALRDQTGKGPAFYAAQLKLGEAIAAGLEALVSSDAAMLHDELSGIAERIVLGDVAGHNQVLNAALLVQRTARTRTDEAIARLSRTLPDRLRLRYIGPQPPYSFVDGELAGDPVWA